MKKHILSAVFMAGLMLFSSFAADAQSRGKKKGRTAKAQLVSVVGTVVDQEGNPLSAVQVSAAEGRYKATTDEAGRFSFKCEAKADVLFELDGYEDKHSTQELLKATNTIVLEEMLFQMSSKDIVSVPFGAREKKYTTGSVSTIRPEDFLDSDNQRSVKQVVTNRLLGALNGDNSRGSHILYVVDGFVRDSRLIEGLDVNDVEEISFMKDAVSRVLYGPYADEGIVMIKTKRGEANKRTIKAGVETGFGAVYSTPQYMNSEDYMKYYNVARMSDGLGQFYSSEQIDLAKNGYGEVGYPDMDLYSKEFMRSVKPTTNVDLAFSGGNKISKYYLTMGWAHDGSIIKMGEKTRNNSFDVKANVDIDVTKFLKVSVDAGVLFNQRNSPQYGEKNFWQMASQFRPNDFMPLIPVSMIGESSQDLVNSAKLVNGKYLLGGSSIYQQNPYGDLLLKGYRKANDLNIQLNFAMDFDLGMITEGLKFHTAFAFDDASSYTVSQNNTYAVYDPVYNPETQKFDITRVGEDKFAGTQSVGNTGFMRRMGWNGILSWTRDFNDKHHVDVRALSFIDTYSFNNNMYTQRHANFGFSANYAYAQKYIVDFAAVLSGTSKLQNKWGFAPTAGFAWVASEEGFMKDQEVVSFLKFKVSGGMIKTDQSDKWSNPYLYKDNFNKGDLFNYNDGNKNEVMQLTSLGNPNLTWIERREISAGFELGFFNNELLIEGNYYNIYKSNELEQLNNKYFTFIGGGSNTFIPYENYSSTETNGWELAINYNKKFNRDWALNAGFSIMNFKKMNRIVNEYDYEGIDLENLGKANRPADAIRGLQANGFYTQEQIDAINGTAEHPSPLFGNYAAGDLNYTDRNGDGVINDNDFAIIGNSTPRFTYNLNLDLRWKGFEIYAMFRSQTGFYGNHAQNGYWGYVSGNEKYPERLKDSWMYIPEIGLDTRATAKYPRLSSLSSAHNKKTSTFWLRKKDYFSMPVLQFTYHLPSMAVNKIRLSDASVYFRATNLFHVSADSEIAKLNVGSEPQYRFFTFGLKLQF